MDELEISGKRYISTRRAAKQHKYHSDYIGQLIRGKKLLGRKVGRSWYVELDSLTTYFGKEGSGAFELTEQVESAVIIDAAPVVIKEEKKEEIEIAQPIVAAQPIEEKVEEIILTPEKDSIAQNEVRDSIHIPIRVERPSFTNTQVVGGSRLTYVSDEQPYIPTMQRDSHSILNAAVVMPRTYEEVVEIKEASIKKASPIKNSAWFVAPLRIAVLGVFVFALVVGSSYFVSSQTIIEAGKAASVGLALP